MGIEMQSRRKKVLHQAAQVLKWRRRVTRILSITCAESCDLPGQPRMRFVDLSSRSCLIERGRYKVTLRTWTLLRSRPGTVCSSLTSYCLLPLRLARTSKQQLHSATETEEALKTSPSHNRSLQRTISLPPSVLVPSNTKDPPSVRR